MYVCVHAMHVCPVYAQERHLDELIGIFHYWHLAGSPSYSMLLAAE